MSKAIQSRASLLAGEMLEQWGIRAINMTGRPDGFVFDVKSIQAAAEVLRRFRRHRVQVIAIDALNFRIFLPTSAEKLLK